MPIFRVVRSVSARIRRVGKSRLSSSNPFSFQRSITVSSWVRDAHSSQPTENELIDSKPEDVVWNPCQIQMIPDELYSQIFIDSFRKKSFEPGIVSKCKSHLEAHSLWGQEVKPIPAVSLQLPPLQGEDINDHFRNIALQQTFRYKKLLDSLVGSEIPSKPERWMYVEGWTKYLEDGTSVAVPCPREDAMFFDVEVCVGNGPTPTLACALTPKHWYSWCSKILVQKSSSDAEHRGKLTLDDLIPLEAGLEECTKEKIVIGHNVSYDRARIKEQYYLKNSKTRFLDTMSLHIAISGITSYQRALKLTAKAGLKNVDIAQLRKFGVESNFLEWNDQSSLNNLADVYKLYCGKELSKSSRDVFVKGTLDDVREDFQNLMSYCANDVGATKNIFTQLLPLFYERFPHPVTFAGMLEMGSTYLPINSNWNKYIKKSESTFNECVFEVKSILMQKANEALELLEGEKFKDDPWLWDLDWKVVKKRKTKNSSSAEDTQAYPAWYRKLLYKTTDPDYVPGPAKISTSMQMVPKLLRLTWFGFPLHHSRKGGWGFLVKAPDSQALEMEDNEMPVDENELPEDESPVSGFPYDEWLKVWDTAKDDLLKLKFVRSEGKESLADFSSAQLRNKSEQSAEELEDFIRGLQSLTAQGLWAKGKRKKASGTQIECSPHPKCIFIPLPHKDGPSNRVGNPLAKDFLSKIEEGVLTSSEDNSLANKVVRLSKMSSYWKNNRDRIMGQMSVWLRPNEINGQLDNCEEKESNFEYGAILPQVAVSGTLTRRAVEPTWMTASNAYEDRIGSELKGLIQAPPNFHFVGADVDSQELWIASIIGDASFTGIYGSTALGWMTLQGNKSAGTDMHSKTASLIGIGRDQAKILNYGRIYGAGVNFAERLLTQFNKHLTSADARQKAKTMYKMTKGERKYILNKQGKQLCDAFEDLRDRKDEPFSKTEVRTLLSYHEIPSHNYMELVDKLVWDGGTESQMFNRLEEIAQEECPKTPFLECCISRSLVPAVVQNDFMTSRVNWVVQSSAVDYLHLMLTCMRWLTEKYDIDARFAISVHDEVRYIVRTEDRYRAALALQITNLLTRSAFSYQLGMYDLPMSVAYFSCVDIDKVLRKEVTHDCKTPSNPNGLSGGYEVALGQGVDIIELLQLTKGTLRKH